MEPILSQFNPVHKVTTYFCKILLIPKSPNTFFQHRISSQSFLSILRHGAAGPPFTGCIHSWYMYLKPISSPVRVHQSI